MQEYTEIEVVNKIQYAGNVYNVETVAEEFVAEGIVCHNCPHFWSNDPEKIPQEDCVLLWMGR